MGTFIVRLGLLLYACCGVWAAKKPACRIANLDDAAHRLGGLLAAPYHEAATLSPARDVFVSVGRKDATNIYALAEKLWNESYDREELNRLLGKVASQWPLLPEETLRLKAIRKNAMLLRALFLALDIDHEPPAALHAFVRDFGQMNDFLALDGEHMPRRLAKSLLKQMKGNTLEKAIAKFSPARRGDIAKHAKSVVAKISAALDHERLPADDFHTVRKQLREIQAVLRVELSFNENPGLRIFIDHLHALNQRTGELHDQLVRDDIGGAIDYDDYSIGVPADLRRDIKALLAHLKFTPAPTSGSGP